VTNKSCPEKRWLKDFLVTGNKGELKDLWRPKEEQNLKKEGELCTVTRGKGREKIGPLVESDQAKGEKTS